MNSSHSIAYVGGSLSAHSLVEVGPQVGLMVGGNIILPGRKFIIVRQFYQIRCSHIGEEFSKWPGQLFHKSLENQYP